MAIKAGQMKKGLGALKLPSAGTPSESDEAKALRTLLIDALREKGYLTAPTTKNPYPSGGIQDVYDDTVVFSKDWDGDLAACNFVVKDGKATLGKKEPVERRTIYVKVGS